MYKSKTKLNAKRREADALSLSADDDPLLTALAALHMPMLELVTHARDPPLR